MLTKSQQKTYLFVKSYIEEHGIAPTMPEIASGIGLKSRGTIHRYLDQLIRLGFLAKSKPDHFSRNLYVTHKLPRHGHCYVHQSIPLAGVIAAGQPIEAISDNESYDINELLIGDELFMLRVKGNSMIEEGIYDGDYVVCEKKSSANDGDIVVALIRDAEATLKRFYRQDNNKVLLCPANTQMTPLEFDAGEIAIQGILRCQLRKY